MNGVVIPLITCFVGAMSGFLITRLNDWLSERRELRRARRHLRTEAANVVRHYTIMQERLASFETDPVWRNAIHLETCRFYGNGLGTFDLGTLRLFDEESAEDAIYLMMMIRNNNSYVDQAKVYMASEDPDQFREVCREFIERTRMTIDRAKEMGIRFA